MSNNREMGGVFRMKREIKRLKAEIRELKGALETSEAIALKFMDRATEERDRAGKLMAERSDVQNVIMKASHRNLDYQKTLRELERQMFNDWLELDNCFMGLVR